MNVGMIKYMDESSMSVAFVLEASRGVWLGG